MELETLERCFNLSTLLSNQNKENFADLLNFIKKFSLLHDEEAKKLPYHINVIDELHAGENAHSRIFAQLLRYKTGTEFPFLKHFLNDICGFNLHLKNPTVGQVDSCGRVDIPIFDINYVVLIENKVTDKAPDQNTEAGGQLARYIDAININYGRSLEEIFVVYTPKYTREPSDECWQRIDGFSYKKDFKSRFKSVSYRDDIYPWLKKLEISEKQAVRNYLSSTLHQYIDHLEGLFSLRLINKEMNMNLQKFIKKQLELEDMIPEKALVILEDKKKELSNAIAQIEFLTSEYHKEIVKTKFGEYRELLKIDFPTLQIVGDEFKNNFDVINVGVLWNSAGKIFSLLIECNQCEPVKIYYGLSSKFTNYENPVIPSSLQTVLNKETWQIPDDNYSHWRYTTLFNGYEELKSMIKQTVIAI